MRGKTFMLRILLIDDNPNDRLIATRELKQLSPDVDIREVIDQESLDRSIAAGEFDLVVTDYRLFWSDGLTVLRRVKALYPECPVIMVTDSGSEEVAVEGMKSGLSDYVLKHRQIYRLALAVRESLEKQRLRQQYAEAVEKLSISEERLRLAFTSAQLGTWDWNLPTGQVTWSRNHEYLFGVTQDTFLDQDESFITCVHPDDQPSVIAAIATARSTQTDYSQEFRIIWPDQSIHWISGRGKFFYNAAGHAIRMIGVVWDVTERKQIEVERQQLLEAERFARTTAENANRIKDEFLATLSHELRSPLNAILGWSKLLRSSKFNPTTLPRALETIERNAKLQTQLIEDLLDISRILRGNFCLNIAPVNLISPIEAAIDTMRLAASANAIQLQTTLDEQVGLVSGDASRLQQIVWNLLSNAIKFTPAGGWVEIRLERVDGGDASEGGEKGMNDAVDHRTFPHVTPSIPPFHSYALITVTDTGKGIPASFLPYVFESFRQADSSTTRQYGGLGLGLAIVRHLVEMHGGKVWVESEGENRGATFRVKLPLMQERVEQAPIDPQPEGYPVPSISLHNVRILIVDDEPDNGEFLVVVLQQYGAIAKAVGSAREAIEELEDFAPDVLISDIGMPEEDGYTLIRKVRSQQAQHEKDLTAIALTAYARWEDRERAIAAGFQEHLAKPVEPQALVATIINIRTSVK
jgi:PAS domain S-box-containing protein